MTKVSHNGARPYGGIAMGKKLLGLMVELSVLGAIGGIVRAAEPETDADDSYPCGHWLSATLVY